MKSNKKIYLMRDGPTGYYKIGCSNNPLGREDTLLAQAPKIVLLTYWDDCTPAQESRLHNIFAEYRRRGEWFELPDISTVAKVYREMQEYVRYDVVVPSPELAALLAGIPGLICTAVPQPRSFVKLSVMPETREQLKRIAAHTGKPMFKVVEDMFRPVEREGDQNED